MTALAERVAAEHGGLDLLVVDFWGDYAPVAFGTPFWEIPDGSRPARPSRARCGRTC